MLARPAGLLGDTAARDYSRKLRQFNSFAAPELRQAIAGLGLTPGMRVLDAGCGTGEALQWLSDAIAPHGVVVGIDLAAAHVSAARAAAAGQGASAGLITVLQADVMRPPFAPRSFDLVWSVNTINHLREPLAGVWVLANLLCPGGRVAMGQSSLLPEMFFAWDSRLERLTTEAVRRYYRDRYGLSEHEVADSRSIVGLLRRAALRHVHVQTYIIERVSPLNDADEAYLIETIFRDTWGERLRPYLTDEDYDELTAVCNPRHPAFALNRTDFHFLQTFTLAVGELA
ncbi:MAG TPA: methyltransferase domain-containing protein [Steroidobacteraceae bacterium]